MVLVHDHHEFAEWNYKAPTFCGVCGKFLWGLSKQGCKCAHCGYNVHAGCVALVASSCSDTTSKSQRTPTSTRDPAPATTNTTAVPVPAVAPIPPADREPPLNLFTTTPLNLTKFIQRITPVVIFAETVEDVFLWKSVPVTLVVLFSFILLCKYCFCFCSYFVSASKPGCVCCRSDDI